MYGGVGAHEFVFGFPEGGDSVYGDWRALRERLGRSGRDGQREMDGDTDRDRDRGTEADNDGILLAPPSLCSFTSRLQTTLKAPAFEIGRCQRIQHNEK